MILNKPARGVSPVSPKRTAAVLRRGGFRGAEPPGDFYPGCCGQAPAHVGGYKKPESQRLARAPLPCLNSTTAGEPGRRRAFADTTHAGAQPQLYQHALRIPCSDFVSKVYCFALSVSSLLRVDLRRGTPLLFTTVNDTLNARSSVELNTTCSSELAGASSNVRFSGSSASRDSLHVCSHHCIHACCISLLSIGHRCTSGRCDT